MITELRISDLGVINEATLVPCPGLTVVTGETGAGKTMIVSSIDLLLGGRADPRSVRNGAARARVEGRFTVDDLALQRRVEGAGGELDDTELIVARHLTAAGRSRAFLGGAAVPASFCADVAGDLVTVCGQSEQVRLGQPERQRTVLDRYAGEQHLARLESYRDRWVEHQRAAGELVDLRNAAQERAREVDLLTYGLEEIARVDPQPGEDVELAAEAERLQQADDLRGHAQQTIEALAGDDDEHGGALNGLARARRSAETLAETDPGAADLARRTAEIGYLVADVTADLARYLERLDAEPGRLEQIAARRSALALLTRKYGHSADEVLEWSVRARDRLGGLVAADDRIEQLEARVVALDTTLHAVADELSASRSAAAAELSHQVVAELSALAMPHARLSFAVTRGPHLGPDGRDAVELLFSANPGSPPRALAKVASGGELSRVRLALEVVLAARSSARTFVFDEVDAGVGGAVAVEIGRRLATLAQHAQVIVVTHLAQVAAFADRHFVVVKPDDGQVTTSGVTELAETARAEELARMMAGIQTTDSALAHAGELVELAARHHASH
ncbi:MAG: DNA repair protein RecN [Propionibacteriaceae bacterium]